MDKCSKEEQLIEEYLRRTLKMQDKIKPLGCNQSYTKEELKERQEKGYSIGVNII
jgi:hypothetical protein